MIPVEIIGAISALAGFFFKAHSASIEGMRQLAEIAIMKDAAANELANAASQRSNPTARKILAFLIVGTVMAGLAWIGIWSIWKPDALVSLVSDYPKNSLLWGLLEWGGGAKVIEAHGFVIPEQMWTLIYMVGFFFLGTGSAKPSR